MELVRSLERPPPSRRTVAAEVQLRQDIRASASLATFSSLSSSSLSSPTSVSSQKHHISVQRAPLQELFSFASSIPINSRTSVDAVLRGTRIRMLEMRLKMQHKVPRPKTRLKFFDYAGLIGLTAATDLHRRHRLTLESSLGSDGDRQSMSTFVSSKFESRLSWGLAISHKVHRTLTFFSRYNSDDYAQNHFILQVVHKLNENTTLSPIVSVSTGCQPKAGFSWIRQLTEMDIMNGWERLVASLLICTSGEDILEIVQERLINALIHIV